MDIIETIKGKNGLVANLYQDDNASNPREDDNLGRIATARLRRHNLADRGEAALPEDLSGWGEVMAHVCRERGAAVILPVFMYEHSGMAISTRSFRGRAQHAEWDSGQIGFIYATRAGILASLMIKRITKAAIAHTERILEGEIETLNQYISGDVYGYQIVKPCPACGKENSDGLDSCWGFYGIEYARKEAEAALKAAAKEA